MTVTHVMAEMDAERVFPWDHEGPHTGADPRDYGRAIPPSVKWIVAAEPIAETTVEIQSRCRDTQCGCGETGYIVCGVVTVGAAVPIDGEDCEHYIDQWIEVWLDGRIAWYRWDEAAAEHYGTDITDQFGGQAVTPGHYAHPILSSPDGTYETRVA